VEDYEEILRKEPGLDFRAIKERYGVGSMCSSCEYEAKGLLIEFPLTQRAKPPRPTLRKVVEGYMGWLRSAQKGGAKRESRSEGKTYYTGIFAMRKNGLATRLAVANLTFPEHEANANGGEVRFEAALFGSEGEELGRSREMVLRDGESREYRLEELFPEVVGELVGSIYVNFPDLRQTGSLRPYGILVSESEAVRARCHYHDKFGCFQEPGYVQNTSPFELGQECWMAVAKCQAKPYETEVGLLLGGRRSTGELKIPAMGSRWVKLEDIFSGDGFVDVRSGEPGLFWLENPQHVMVYFFWYSPSSRTWMGQHH
jgi:bacterioferritin-associated ferredoxin